MNRGDVVLLVGWCLLIFFGYRFLEFPLSVAILAVLVSGIVFALRLYLARRSFRPKG